ncbi:hypothetical protein BKA24_001663 [Microbacterium marinum]|uniref:Uncharacterized protein n=1 Tax=Microbacterium marinum TaxID=421115 RepID=A0A7W7FL25_9MICO|nr:hypothetical protein [Microbacterium marinum]MBB4666954.1 hypothetical protein [Microbacterium marinum]
MKSARSERVTLAALAEIEKRQQRFPVCALVSCNQRVKRLDEFGLCSKVSDSHKVWRAQTRREMGVVFR